MRRATLQIAALSLLTSGIAEAQQPPAQIRDRAVIERVRQSDAPFRRRATDPAVPLVPVDPVVARDALIAAADEYVADALPLTPEKLDGIRHGAVLPFCEKYAPDLEVMIGNNGRGPSAAETANIALAVKTAIIKRNLVRLGIDPVQAESWTNAYYNDVAGPGPAMRAVRVTETIREQPPLAVAGAASMRQAGAIQRRDQLVRPSAELQAGASAGIAARARVRAAPTIAAASVVAPPALGGRPDTPDRRLVRTINAWPAKPAGFPTLADPAYISCTTAAAMTRTTPYRLRPVPAEGRVFVLPRFSFRLCELQKLDPYDRSRCQNWVDVSGQPANLIGRYAVSAEWASGKPNRGTRDFAYIDAREHVIDFSPAP